LNKSIIELFTLDYSPTSNIGIVTAGIRKEEEESWYKKLIKLSEADYPDDSKKSDFIKNMEENAFTVKDGGITPQMKSKAKAGEVNSEKKTIIQFVLASFKYRYNSNAPIDRRKIDRKFVKEIKEILKVAGHYLNDPEDRVINYMKLWKKMPNMIMKNMRLFAKPLMKEMRN